jgi:hypothetical protein
MKFSLTAQNLEAGTPLPVSSISCPVAPTLNSTSPPTLDSTAKGLIGVGVVLGVLILVLSLFALYKWCWEPRRAHGEPQDIPAGAILLPSMNGVGTEEPAISGPDLPDLSGTKLKALVAVNDSPPSDPKSAPTSRISRKQRPESGKLA